MDVGKGEPLSTVHFFNGGIAGTAAIKISVGNPPHAKSKITTAPAVPLLGTCPKDSTSYPTDACLVVPLAALCAVARKRKLPNVHQQRSRQ